MFSPVNSDPNRNSNEAPQLPKCDQFFAGIPFSCLVFYFTLVILWIIDLFTGIGNDYLYNNYEKSASNYQIWRLFTSAFFEPSLLMVCFIIFNFQSFLPSLELKKGSTFLIVDLISRNLKVQLLVLLIEIILRTFEIDFFNKNGGTLGLWFNYMTIFCWLNPKQMKLCCFDVRFNRKFYPLVFGLIITAIGWQIRIDMIAGIILGLLQSTILKNMKDFLQSTHYQSIEAIFSNIGVTSFKNWIRLNPSRFVDNLCTSNVYSNIEFEQNQLLNSADQMEERTMKYSSSTNTEKNTDYFSNLKGVRIGDY